MVRPIVADAIRHFEGEQLHGGHPFVVMPNHVHVPFRLKNPIRLERIIKSWKRI